MNTKQSEAKQETTGATRKMSVQEKQLRANIISLYTGYESEMTELALRFGISEKQVREYVEEQNELHRELYGKPMWENKGISIKGDGKMPNGKNVKGNEKTDGAEVRDLAKTAAVPAAEIVEKGKGKGVPPNLRGNIKAAGKIEEPQGKVNEGESANESIVMKTNPKNLDTIRAIAKSVNLRPIESKSQTPGGTKIAVVKIDVPGETIKILRRLKKVLGSSLPTAINRIELDPKGLIFEFYVKYGRGPIYIKRAKGTGIICTAGPTKKETTAGDMRSVHLVTLKIPATKLSASQVVKLWGLLKYGAGSPKK